MDKSKWTENRKILCEEFWDHCAQKELYCANGLGVPCDRILEAEKNSILIIELDHPWTNCTICNKETPIGYSIPMYEGKKVDTTKTDEWAGQAVCKECYDDDALSCGYSVGNRQKVR